MLIKRVGMLVWDMYDIVSTIVTTHVDKRVGMLVWDMYDIVSTIVTNSC